MCLLVVEGEPLRDLIYLAAAFACADHAEHERWEHLLRLECGGQAGALPHLTQNILVNAAQTCADALILRDDRQRAHQTDARSQQRGQLTAQVAQLLRTQCARLAARTAAGRTLQIQSLRE